MSWDNPSLNLARIREDALAKWDKHRYEEAQERKRQEEEEVRLKQAEQKNKEEQWAKKYMAEIERILSEEYPKAAHVRSIRPTHNVWFEAKLNLDEDRPVDFPEAFEAYCYKQGFKAMCVYPTKPDIPVSFGVLKRFDSPGAC